MALLYRLDTIMPFFHAVTSALCETTCYLCQQFCLLLPVETTLLLLFTFFQILFWSSVLLVAHSYVLYPLLQQLWAKNSHPNSHTFSKEEALPPVWIFMAVYNEATVIADKLESVFNTTYPTQAIRLIIGSDNSTDNTHQIIETFKQQHPNYYVQLTIFAGRNGKINIINQLIATHKQAFAPNAAMVLTDANVLFSTDMLYQLLKHFKTESIGLVAANVLNKSAKQATGIALQEKWYIQHENLVKYHEGINFGYMMGAFGACYALKAKLFKPVPTNFIVDDFFQTLQLIEQGYQAIKEPLATCYEDVSTDMWEEFRRKKRISAGNFQNLKRFSHLLSPSRGMLAFSFWSHKVLRWLSPFFIITALISLIYLSAKTKFYQVLLLLQFGSLLVPLLDVIANKFNIHLKLFRFIRYFYAMNIALLIGFFNYIKGIQTNVWKPTKRNR